MRRPLLLAPPAVPWQLLARFDGTLTAPLPNPLPCDVGTLTVADTNSRFSKSGGTLAIAAAASGVNDGLISPSTFTRVAGRALLVDVPTPPASTTGQIRVGWSAAALAASDLDCGIDWGGASAALRIKKSVSAIETVTLASGPQALAFVLRSSGALLLLRAGTSGPYTLAWVYNAETAAEYAKCWISANSVAANLDNLRVVDLGGVWANDYGICTKRLANPTAGTLTTATPDAVVEWTFVHSGTTDTRVDVRFTDASNHWRLLCRASDGGFFLLEDAATIVSTRSSAGSVFTAGNTYRVVVTLEGTSIKAYVNDVSKLTYGSASTNQTATGVNVTSDGGGGISQLVTWPRTIALPSWAA